MEIINKSFVQESFENLIKLFKGEEQSNNIESTITPIKNKSKLTNKKKLSSNSKKKKSFLGENFCDDECYNKFTKVMQKIKSGEVDINKINWSDVKEKEVGVQQSSNLVQNLVNYYFTMGYNQGVQENTANKAE